LWFALTCCGEASPINRGHGFHDKYRAQISWKLRAWGRLVATCTTHYATDPWGRNYFYCPRFNGSKIGMGAFPGSSRRRGEF
jgi:hypothetical protein